MNNIMQFWSGDMVRFMKDASEYGDYNKKLAERLSAYLTKDMAVCDAGCGLGYLSLALAPYVKSVTSVEKNEDALAVLGENLKKLGIENVTPCLSDIGSLDKAQKFDAMVFCFFGGIEEILDIAEKHCTGDVFVITRAYKTHRFSVGKYPVDSFGNKTSGQVLKERNIPFDEAEFSLEFGQPFSSFESAMRFYETYSKDNDKSVITEEFVRSKLEETGREDFPFYMPHERKIAMLRFKV